MKAKRRLAQLRPKHQTNLKWLQRSEVQQYQQALATALELVEREENVECMLKKLRAAVENAQKSLSLVSDKPEADWVTDEVQQLSAEKQEAWIRWKKRTVDNSVAHTEYHRLKNLTQRAVKKAQNVQCGRTK